MKKNNPEAGILQAIEKTEKGIIEIKKDITSKQQLLDKQKHKLKELYSKIENESINYDVSQHAVYQFLSRFQPELLNEIKTVIRENQHIKRRVKDNVITTVIPRKGASLNDLIKFTLSK